MFACADGRARRSVITVDFSVSTGVRAVHVDEADVKIPVGAEGQHRVGLHVGNELSDASDGVVGRHVGATAVGIVEPNVLAHAKHIVKLRLGNNPFSFRVATAGTEKDCLEYDVPELLDAQRADLLAIVQLYRKGHPSRVFPVLGDPGTGKTHLLTTFQAMLQLEAVESGISTLEQEFLANIVTEGGRTIGEVILPRLSEAVEAGRLLPPAQGDE